MIATREITVQDTGFITAARELINAQPQQRYQFDLGATISASVEPHAVNAAVTVLDAFHAGREQDQELLAAAYIKSAQDYWDSYANTPEEYSLWQERFSDQPYSEYESFVRHGGNEVQFGVNGALTAARDLLKSEPYRRPMALAMCLANEVAMAIAGNRDNA